MTQIVRLIDRIKEGKNSQFDLLDYGIYTPRNIINEIKNIEDTHKSIDLESLNEKTKIINYILSHQNFLMDNLLDEKMTIRKYSN